MLFLFILSDCQKPKKYPIEPHIEYKKHYAKKDSIDKNGKIDFIRVTLHLIDGDGDLGVHTNENKKNRSSDLHTKLFYVKNNKEYRYKLYRPGQGTIDSLKKKNAPENIIEKMAEYIEDSKRMGYIDEAQFSFIIKQYFPEEQFNKYKEMILKYSLDTELENYSMPYIKQSEGKNKTLKADIEVNFTYDVSTLLDALPYDTVFYEMYIYDRAKHKSNTIITPYIIFEDDNNK